MTNDKLIMLEEVVRRTGDLNISSGKTMSYIRRKIIFLLVPYFVLYFFPADMSFVPYKGDSDYIVFSMNAKIILYALKLCAGES